MGPQRRCSEAVATRRSKRPDLVLPLLEMHRCWAVALPWPSAPVLALVVLPCVCVCLDSSQSGSLNPAPEPRHVRRASWGGGSKRTSEAKAEHGSAAASTRVNEREQDPFCDARDPCPMELRPRVHVCTLVRQIRRPKGRKGVCGPVRRGMGRRERTCAHVSRLHGATTGRAHAAGLSAVCTARS